MTLQEKKEWLSRYRDTQNRIDRLMLEELGLRSLAEKTTTCYSLTPHTQGNTMSKQENFVTRVEDVQELMETLERQSEQYKKEIQAAIDTVEDVDSKRYMEYFYIEGLQWYLICDLVGYTDRGLRKITNNAISKMKIESVPPSSYQFRS